jgi:predicted alpha/beta superfamily hydrolase
MNYKSFRTPFLLTLLFILPATTLFGQGIEIGYQDSLESKVLKETRRLFVSLPKDYNSSDKVYPVIYGLDGDVDFFIETVGVIYRLTYTEEVLPEVILVMIENTDRNRDMMPTNTGFFTKEPGAEKFKEFIEDELFIHMSNSYRITDERILFGQSLSSIFTLYCFLTSPDMFDSYIASSAGFPDCEPYFTQLTKKSLESEQQKLKKIFLSYGSKDFLDPDGVIGKQLSDFTQLIEADKNIDYLYKIYEEEGHVPFQSLYHGLKFVSE